MLSETFLTYGQATAPAVPLPLRAGPLTMLYDPSSGFVRRITLGEHEVLRGIYAAVRDHNWGTPPGVLREISREVETQSFRIEFESEHRQGGIHFIWRGTLLGADDGTLRYEFDGRAKSTFLRNRIGICVLHPIGECAGARATQTRTDGQRLDCRFPELIEPQIIGQSTFHDLRAIAHEVTDGLWAELEFKGDTFEMEDQRNWTDASFKTYCTPLASPFPVEIKAGMRVQQTVTLRLMDTRPEDRAGRIEVLSGTDEEIRVTIPDAPATRLPAIGLGVASHGEPLCDEEVRILRRLHPSHLRVDLRLTSTDWQARLDQAVQEAKLLGARLELAIHLPRRGEVDTDSVASAIRHQAALVARVLALREAEAATTPQTLRQVRALLGGANAPVGAGSDCNFCELNREHALGRLARLDADFLFWSVNPQVHAYDHLSIMETLEAQSATVISARTLAAGRPLAVSPITLKQRFNPVAIGLEPEPSPGELPSQVDPRQLSLFGAAWTLGSVVALASAALESLTYYETTGWRGVMERARGLGRPEKFPSSSGGVFPLFYVLAALAGFRDAAVGSATGEVAVLSLFRDGALKRVVLGNLTPGARQIRFDAKDKIFNRFLLDATTARLVIQNRSADWLQEPGRTEFRGKTVRSALPPFALMMLETT